MEVHLAQQRRIDDECPRDVIQAIRKIGPDDVADHVEEKWWGTVGGQARDTAEYDGENEGGQQGTHDVPGRSEHGLLVDGDEVAPDKKADEVAIAPQLPQPPVEPAPL